MSKIVNRTLDFFEVFVQQGRPLSNCHDVVQAAEELAGS